MDAYISMIVGGIIGGLAALALSGWEWLIAKKPE
jgi:hypothetical protein